MKCSYLCSEHTSINKQHSSRGQEEVLNFPQCWGQGDSAVYFQGSREMLGNPTQRHVSPQLRAIAPVWPLLSSPLFLPHSAPSPSLCPLGLASWNLACLVSIVALPVPCPKPLTAPLAPSKGPRAPQLGHRSEDWGHLQTVNPEEEEWGGEMGAVPTRLLIAHPPPRPQPFLQKQQGIS